MSESHLNVPEFERRHFLRQSAALAGGLLTASQSALLVAQDAVPAQSKPLPHVVKKEKSMALVLPDLTYAYDSLEKSIDARTMEIHHTKHHGAYVTNCNNATAGTEWEGKSVEELMANISKLPVLCATMAADITTTACSGRCCRPTAAVSPRVRCWQILKPLLAISPSSARNSQRRAQPVLAPAGRGCRSMRRVSWWCLPPRTRTTRSWILPK